MQRLIAHDIIKAVRIIEEKEREHEQVLKAKDQEYKQELEAKDQEIARLKKLLEKGE